MPCDRRGWGGGRGREPVVVLLKTLQSLNREPGGSLFFPSLATKRGDPIPKGPCQLASIFGCFDCYLSYNKPPSNRSSRSEWREWTEGYFGTITPAPSRTRHTGSTTMRSTTTCRPRRQRSASQRWGSAVRTANQRLAARLDEPLTLVPALVRVHLFSHAHRRHAPDPHLEDEILSDRHGRLERRGRRSRGYWGLDRALFARPDSTLTRHVPLSFSFSFSLSFSRWCGKGALRRYWESALGRELSCWRRWQSTGASRVYCARPADVRSPAARRPPPFASPYSTLTRATVRIARSPAS